MLPHAKKFVLTANNQQERFKKAVLCAIVGNIMEFDVPGHKFTLTVWPEFCGKQRKTSLLMI